MHRIPFNRPFVTGREGASIREAVARGHLSGDGTFSKRCSAWLERTVGCRRALLTPSCTAALEMAALLVDIQPGDEIIMPSFTFVSTANAFVLRGGVPVFVDIRPDTLNLDERLIEDAVTRRTRAIALVHYAGIACELAVIMATAERRRLLVIEDAANALLGTWRGRPLGSFGHLAALSFHETKNVMAGEGGALLINDACHIDRAEILREKGTNRTRFFRGEVDKYTWVDVGSSYLPSEVTAAFLWAQLEEAAAITEQRRAVWERYHEAFVDLERQGSVRRPTVPAECGHNAHGYHLLFRDGGVRDTVLRRLRGEGIQAVFHYVPLHSSPAGLKFGRAHGSMVETDSASERLLRLPLWVGMGEVEVATVASAVRRALS